MCWNYTKQNFNASTRKWLKRYLDMLLSWLLLKWCRCNQTAVMSNGKAKRSTWWNSSTWFTSHPGGSLIGIPQLPQTNDPEWCHRTQWDWIETYNCSFMPSHNSYTTSASRSVVHVAADRHCQWCRGCCGRLGSLSGVDNVALEFWLWILSISDVYPPVYIMFAPLKFNVDSQNFKHISRDLPFPSHRFCFISISILYFTWHQRSCSSPFLHSPQRTVAMPPLLVLVTPKRSPGMAVVQLWSFKGVFGRDDS